MKTVQFIIYLAVFSLTSACALNLGHFDEVERDELLNKLPLLNGEILGELKYDNLGLDLRRLMVQDYIDLFNLVEITDDDKKILDFVQNRTSEKTFLMLQDTFIVCIRSKKKRIILCDDASTSFVDRIIVGDSVPPLDVFTKDFIGKLHL